MNPEKLDKIVTSALNVQLVWDAERKQFSGGIADLLRESSQSGRKTHKAIYDEAIRYVKSGSWREIAQASMYGRISGVPVFAFVSAVKDAGHDDDRILKNLNYDGRGGYSAVEVQDALDRYNWNNANPDDRVPTKQGRTR